MFDETAKREKRQLGDFEILRELGRGGMGVVYEARQVSLNRKVALKVLSASLGLSGKTVIRFKREAEAAARLHHTNIVPIYSTGEQDGTHYYAMELIDGPGLDQVIQQVRRSGTAPSLSVPRPDEAAAPPAGDAQNTAPGWAVQTVGFESAPSPGNTSDARSLTSSFSSGAGGYFDTLARIFADVADALDYAHTQGVVHRDIKPSNLLLSSDGRLHVNDFGLARMLEQPGMTVSGEFVGSPMYMSPEQIAVGRAPLDHRTDVYSLGSSLYEALTLEAPFSGQRRDQVIAQIMHKDPRRPRLVNRKIPLDLETICLKAMEKDPDTRYQTAGGMARDLRAYTNRFAISARRVGPLGRAVRWVRRHKPLAAALACLVVISAIAASLAVRAHLTERQHRREAIERELDDGSRFVLYGDYDRADQAVARAVAMGATGGRLHLLRGEIASNHGGDAVKELQQAVADLPESVEARAWLAEVYSGEGRYDDFFSTIRQAESLQPRTAGDYLALGMAVSGQDPERGVALLDKAVELRVTPLALLERAWARTQCADDGMDPRLLELAVQDVAAAKTILPADDTNCMFRAMQVWVSAARIYRLRGMDAKRQDVLRLAAGEVAAADQLPMLPDRIAARMYYYTEMNEPEPRLHWIKIRYEQFPSDAARMAYAIELFWRGQTQQAVDLLAGDSLDFQFYKALFLPDAADAMREAMRIYSRLQTHGSLVNRLYSHYIPMITGHADIARADALALRATGITFPSLRGWSNRVLDYHCGLLSDEELFQAAARSNWCHTEAYFNIALRRLDEGDRDAALATFRKCADLGVQDYEEYYLAVGLVHRMEADPQWPRWLPGSPSRRPATLPVNVRQRDDF